MFGAGKMSMGAVQASTCSGALSRIGGGGSNVECTASPGIGFGTGGVGKKWMQASGRRYAGLQVRRNYVRITGIDAARFLQNIGAKEVEARREMKPILDDRLPNLMAEKHVLKTAVHARNDQNWNMVSAPSDRSSHEGNRKEDYMVRAQQMWEEGSKAVADEESAQTENVESGNAAKPSENFSSGRDALDFVGRGAKSQNGVEMNGKKNVEHDLAVELDSEEAVESPGEVKAWEEHAAGKVVSEFGGQKEDIMKEIEAEAARLEEETAGEDGEDNSTDESVIKTLAAAPSVDEPAEVDDIAREVATKKGTQDSSQEKAASAIEEESEKTVGETQYPEIRNGVEELEEAMAVKVASESAVEEPDNVQSLLNEDADIVSRFGGESVDKVKKEIKEKAGLDRTDENNSQKNQGAEEREGGKGLNATEVEIQSVAEHMEQLAGALEEEAGKLEERQDLERAVFEENNI